MGAEGAHSTPPHAGPGHPVPSFGDRAVEVDPAAARFDHRDGIAERPGIDRRVQDAVVGRESCKHDLPGAARREDGVESDRGKARSRPFTTGGTPSASGTASGPPRQKSFWTSTTTRKAVLMRGGPQWGAVPLPKLPDFGGRSWRMIRENDPIHQDEKTRESTAARGRGDARPDVRRRRGCTSSASAVDRWVARDFRT